jgi:glycosyltransferase involved in cell wall biosynthesis
VINGEPLLRPTVGVGIYTLRLVRGLLRGAPTLKFRVLLDESLRGKLPEIPEEACVFLPAPSPSLHPLFAQVVRANRAVVTTLRRFPNAVFHSPGPFWSWRRAPRTVVTLHDCIYRHFPLYLGRRGIRKWLTFRTERYAAESDLVLTVSEFSASDLAETAGIPRDNIRVLHNWVEPKYLDRDATRAAAERVRLRHALPPRFWLYVGGYDYRKNVEVLIDAYRAVLVDTPCPPLVLAGEIPPETEPPYSDVRSRLTANGLNEQAHRIGTIAEEDLPGLYAAAELLIYPSLYEGFGLPPLEAIAVGTPVLVSDSSSLPEVVPSATCRFHPLSVSDLAGKLRGAATDPTQFSCELQPQFTEAHAIARYLEFIATVAADK